MLLSEMQQ